MARNKYDVKQSTPLPPTDVLRAKLLAALDRLTLNVAKGGGKLSDCPTTAEAIIHSFLVYQPRQYSSEVLEFRRRYEIVGSTATRREIANFKSAVQKLLQATKQLHAPARAALMLDPTQEQIMFRKSRGWPIEMEFELRLKMLIIQAGNYEMPQLPPNTGRGRKAATQEAKFAFEAAKIFCFKTGKLPTIRTDPLTGKSYGPFLDFLTELFSIFQLEASPIVHARAAAKSMKEILQKNSK